MSRFESSAERQNYFRQLAHVVHLGRCTRFPFGDCHRHEESEYFTPKDNDIASVVLRWLEFDSAAARSLLGAESSVGQVLTEPQEGRDWVNNCCEHGCDCGACYSRSPDQQDPHHCADTRAGELQEGREQ